MCLFVCVCVAQSHCPLLLLSVLSALVSIMPGSSLRLVRLSHAATALPPRIVAYSPRLAIYAALFDFNRPNCRSGSRIDHICSYAVDRCSSRCRTKNKKPLSMMHECTCGRMKWLAICLPFIAAGNKQKFSFFFLLLCCGFWIWWARNIVRFVTFFVDAVMAEMPFSWCYVTFVIRISAVWVHAIWILVIVESSWNAGAALSALSRCRVCLMRRPIENRSRTLTHQPTILYSWLFFFIHSCAIRQAKTTTSERAQRNIPTTHMYVVLCVKTLRVIVLD